MSTPSSEYRAEDSPLLQVGVRCYNAPDASADFAEFANLSNAVTVPANATIVHITGQLGLDDEGVPFKETLINSSTPRSSTLRRT
jgi:hypothetical protein